MTAGAGLHMQQAPALCPGAQERSRARSSVSSSHISLPLDPCTSFPPDSLPAAAAMRQRLCQQTGEKSPHIYYSGEN